MIQPLLRFRKLLIVMLIRNASMPLSWKLGPKFRLWMLWRGIRSIGFWQWFRKLSIIWPISNSNSWDCMKEICKCRECTNKTKVKQKIIKITMIPFRNKQNSWLNTSKGSQMIRWKYKKSYCKLNAPIKHCRTNLKKYKPCSISEVSKWNKYSASQKSII